MNETAEVLGSGKIERTAKVDDLVGTKPDMTTASYLIALQKKMERAIPKYFLCLIRLAMVSRDGSPMKRKSAGSLLGSGKTP